MTEVRLAIVGSTKFAVPEAYKLAMALIQHKLRILTPVVVISGGAQGVDAMAEHAANAAGIPTSIHRPIGNRWAPNGFKDRNMVIAETCTHMLALRCHESTTFGSGWTANYARQLKKNVEVILL